MFDIYRRFNDSGAPINSTIIIKFDGVRFPLFTEESIGLLNFDRVICSAIINISVIKNCEVNKDAVLKGFRYHGYV